MKFGDQLRKHIKSHRESVYRIAKGSGVDATIIGRFLNNKQGLSFSSLELLVEYLGLEITRNKERKIKQQ
jgi:transcriptional regulator with XRE-family HTH domain